MGILRFQKKGDLGRAVVAIGSAPLAQHMDVGRIREYFGTQPLVGGAEVLNMIARERLPAEIETEGELWKSEERGEVTRRGLEKRGNGRWPQQGYMCSR